MFQLIKKKTIQITRTEAGTYVDGFAVKGAEQVVPIEGHIQPLKYHETLKLPESERSKKSCKIYSKFLLRGLDEGDSGYAADRFPWQEDIYEVYKQQNWDVGTTLCDHYCAIALRVEQSPDEVT